MSKRKRARQRKIPAQFSVTDIFADAARYEPDLSRPVRRVLSGDFDIVRPEEPDQLLYTQHTNICAGIALIANDNSSGALMHIYADGGHFYLGEDAVVANTVESWNRMVAHLNPQTEFRAVAFGGHGFNKFAPEGRRTPPEKWKLDFYKRKSQELHALIKTPLYQDLKTKSMQGVLTPQEKEHWKNLRESEHGFYTTTISAEIGPKIGTLVSGWIGDTVYDCARNADFITDLTDLRYKDAPHDALVDLRNGQIIIDKYKDPHRMTVGSKIRKAGCKTTGRTKSERLLPELIVL